MRTTNNGGGRGFVILGRGRFCLPTPDATVESRSVLSAFFPKVIERPTVTQSVCFQLEDRLGILFAP
jgi:hypothetical protein